MSLTCRSVYVTDSRIAPEGHGGGVVSFHELQALTRVSEVAQVYQRLGKLFYEDFYPQNPFMYDYYIASLIKEPESIGLAHFYGASFNLTEKRLRNARKFATVPAHNLELSLQEWGSVGYWQPPPPHLTDDNLFRYLVHGLSDVNVVCPSTSSAKYLKDKLGLASTVIPHGTYLPERFNVDRPQFYAFHLSSFGPDKGQIYLFKAWKRFVAKNPSASLLMCCNNVVETAIENSPNLTVVQYLSEEEKSRHYEGSSVYVQPSVTEGWGLSVGEAMACVPEDTIINSPECLGYFEIDGQGEILEIETASGICLKLTPNHPVLTEDGFLPAKYLKIGDTTYRLVDKYAMDGTRIKDIGRDVSKSLSEQNRQTTGADRESGSSYDLHQGTKEIVRRNVDANRHRSRNRAGGISSRDNRRRRNNNTQTTSQSEDGIWQEKSDSNSNDSNIKFVPCSHRLAKGNITIPECLHTNNSHKERNSAVHILYKGVPHSKSIVEDTHALLNHKKTTSKSFASFHRAETHRETTPKTLWRFGIPSSMFAMVEPETIKKIKGTHVGRYKVYNLSTVANIYFANRLLVHNCGTPVIVSEGVGAKDMVEDGRDGFIVPIRDPDAIIEKLQYFMDNPLEVRRMGHNARITAEKYSWSKIEKMYEALFTDENIVFRKS